MASEPSTFTPVATPSSSAWNAPLRLALASAFACAGLVGAHAGVLQRRTGAWPRRS